MTEQRIDRVDQTPWWPRRRDVRGRWDSSRAERIGVIAVTPEPLACVAAPML